MELHDEDKPVFKITEVPDSHLAKSAVFSLFGK